MTMTHEKFKAELLSDPAVKAEYDALNDAYWGKRALESEKNGDFFKGEEAIKELNKIAKEKGIVSPFKKKNRHIEVVIMSNISLSIDKDVNNHAIDIIEKMGLTLNDAVGLFLEQINKQGKIPFEVSIPNKETIEAMQETDLKPMTLDELSNLWDDIEKTS